MIATTIWCGGYCFRYDPTAPKYGGPDRRVYRLVGFEAFHSISYDPGNSDTHPWRSLNRGHKNAVDAAARTIKLLEQEIVQARKLIACVETHGRKGNK